MYINLFIPLSINSSKSRNCVNINVRFAPIYRVRTFTFSFDYETERIMCNVMTKMEWEWERERKKKKGYAVSFLFHSITFVRPHAMLHRVSFSHYRTDPWKSYGKEKYFLKSYWIPVACNGHSVLMPTTHLYFNPNSAYTYISYFSRALSLFLASSIQMYLVCMHEAD